jgi:release factor glutamine methyltransferase
MRLTLLAYRCVHPLLKMLRTNRAIIRRLFGVRIPRDTKVQFDPTTVLLSKTLGELLTEDDGRVLELGIGQGALVGLSLKRAARHRGWTLALDGIDCSAARVESSRKVAEYNHIDASFWVSDSFAEVPPLRQYDLIFFNSPYVPTRVGKALKLTQRLEVDGDQVWDGGADGTAILRRFLRESGARLSPRGRVVFGVQRIFVPDDLVAEVVAASQLRIEQRLTRRSIPSVVYVVSDRAL